LIDREFQREKEGFMRGISVGAVVLAVSCGLAAWSQAVSVEVVTRIKEVTVFPDGALIVRTGEAKLPSGPVAAVLPGLSASAVDTSLRLSVEGPAKTRFFGVRIKRSFTPEVVEAKTKEIMAKIEEAEGNRDDLKDKVDARTAEMEILKSLTKESARTQAMTGNVAGVAEGTKNVGTRIAQLLAESRKDARAMKKIEERIAALRAELAQVGTGSRERKAAEADLELADAGTVRFELTYMVPRCAWSPVHDLRLDTGKKPRMNMSFAAQIQQSTGEDWEGVRLEISTARPAETGPVPDPTNWWLDFAPPPRPLYRAARAKMAGATMAAAPAAMDEAAPPMEAVEMEQAETIRSEYAATFEIAREATIPADGNLHRVGIAESSHDAALALVCVPRLAQAAFIEASVSYGGDEPLLPGPANLFQGEEFAGTISLPSVAPGETFKVGLGKDQNVKVERKLLTQKAAGGGLLGWTKASRRYNWVTTIKSFHEGVRTIEVREQMPRSRQKDIVVEPVSLDPNPLAEDSGQPGLKRWKIDIKPKGEAKVTFSYLVKFPEGSRVIGLE